MCSDFLGSTAFVPLGQDVFLCNDFGENLASSTSRDSYFEASKRETLDGEGLTSNSSCRSIYDNTVVVKHFDNDGQLSTVRTIVNSDDTANFNKSVKHLICKIRLDIKRKGYITDGWMLISRKGHLPFFHPLQLGMLPACAPCRKHKVKCSRTEPCEKCIKGNRQDQCIYEVSVKKIEEEVVNSERNSTKWSVYDKSMVKNYLGKEKYLSLKRFNVEESIETKSLELQLPKGELLDAIHSSSSLLVDEQFHAFDYQSLLALGLLAQEFIRYHLSCVEEDANVGSDTEECTNDLFMN